MNNIYIFSKEQLEEYKKINSNLKQITKEKVDRTRDKGLCFWCEKRKAEFPKENPQLCPECFVSPFKEELERIAFDIQRYLEMLKAKPRYCAKECEDIIIQMIKQEEKFENFFEEN